jgi:tetratricopeptide (TPR) repeat protein
MLAPKKPRLPEPAIPEGVTGFELDRSVKNQLRTLSKENAVGVGQHLVMVATFLDTDIEAAQAHAETAVRRAGRVPATREALGLVHYRKGEWAKALSEFRTARRLSGSSQLLPYMVDAERGLGRPERALDLAASPEAANLGQDERIELAIVVSGIRRDLGQYEAAAVGLQVPELKAGSRQPWAPRLFYAYAEALLAKGDDGGALTWFSHAADADIEGGTDADERVSELSGLVLTDLLDDDENPDPDGT